MDLEGFYFKINIMDYNKNLDLAPIKYFCEFDLIWKIEEFKDIPNYEGIYQVSDLGRVKSLSRAFVKKGIIHHYLKEKILRLNINSTRYFSVVLYKNCKKKSFQVHQLVAVVFLNHIICGMVFVINHKNFIPTDNKKLNLEIVTQRENANQKHLISTSNFVGVCWNKDKNKWTSKIRINGKMVHLGHFINEIDAHNAYQNKLKEISNLI